MAKRRRINASEMEIPLPIPVIHHIQSFLRGKQAAQTSVLSKSWYDAWLSRPNICFNERCFDGYRRLSFRDFVKTTLQRYKESNLNINSFKLRVLYFYSDEEISELVKEVLKLCVNGADFKLKFPHANKVPWEVLDSKAVVRLSLSRGEIDQPVSAKVACSNLKSLSLERIFINAGLFKDTFPCLEDLTLSRCYGYKELEISSTSLKCITIAENGNLEAKFSVPNIRKFVFSGSSAPALSLMEASTEWEFDISLKYLRQDLSKSWFVKVKGFLRKLNLSVCKVSLSIGFYGYNGVSYAPGFSSGIIPKLENLMLSFPSPIFEYDALIDTLLRICHPKFVTQNWFPEACIEEKANNKLLRFLCRRLMRRDLENVGHTFTYMHLLEAVSVEIFDVTRAKWQPLDWQALLNGSKCLECKQKVRFKLKWQD